MSTDIEDDEGPVCENCGEDHVCALFIRESLSFDLEEPAPDDTPVRFIYFIEDGTEAGKEITLLPVIVSSRDGGIEFLLSEVKQ